MTTPISPESLDAQGGVRPAYSDFAEDVRYYLTQTPRQLPSRYLYDALGSALFEAICHLPWYGITRAESKLLANHGAAIFRHLDSLATIVELGPGSGEKLQILLQGVASRRAPLDVHLVDVSSSALRASMHTLRTVEGIRVIGHAKSYEAGLTDAAREVASSGRTLVLFLGSNIGNFDPPGAAAMLRNVRLQLSPGDALLLGADLVKPAERLLLAYDDPLGVTAAFNRNLLVRINRELQADFDIDEFDHEAVWNAEASRVEMHLRARSPQRVRISGAGLVIGLEAGERIWTESSYKYRSEEIVELLAGAGFRHAAQWTDADESFALTLVHAD